ncbi:MAG: exo-alpha-sialidase [Pirellulales bacterium]
MSTCWPRTLSCLIAALVVAAAAPALAEAQYREELVFPLNPQHNHAPGIVECPNGDLLASWYRGSGERRADDVVVLGARLKKGESTWSETFPLADFSAFPDCNTCMMIDKDQKLWLFWPIILDNEWGSALTNYRVSSDYSGDGPPKWNWQGVIFLKPADFKDKAMELWKKRLAAAPPALAARAKQFEAELEKSLGSKLAQRMGWQPRCKPTVLTTGRILLPLYSDTYSFSIMAVSDDDGQTWYASDVLIGFGNIQPAVLERKDGSLVAYMRENGPLNKIRACESKDQGLTWGEVGTIDLPNPGSGLDAVRLANGHWALIYNDTISGRNSLAVSISEDEGRSWPITRHLEKHATGSYHYPAIIQGADGTLHALYSYFVVDDKGAEGKSMKHAAFNEDWIRAGDGAGK